MTLIGNFQVTTGELDCSTIGPTRTEADFASHIEQTVAIDPDASWAFVADNLNIHCSETLVQVVAKACEITTTLGKKGVRGVLKKPWNLAAVRGTLLIVDASQESQVTSGFPWRCGGPGPPLRLVVT